MIFLQLTDTHYVGGADDDSIKKMLGAIKSSSDNIDDMVNRYDFSDVDFVIVTGDIVHESDNEEDYREFNDILRNTIPPQIPIYYALGNHDRKAAFYKGILNKDHDGEYYYKFDVDGYRIIVLDSAVPGKESGTISKEQLNWLQNELKSTSEKGTIIFEHHPVFWSTEGLTMQLTNNKEVLDMIKNTDVIAIFTGHTHCNGVNVKEQVIQYTADSAAFSIEIRKDKHLVFDDKAGFLKAEINSGKMNVHFEDMQKYNAVYDVPLDVFAEQLSKLDA